MNRILTAMGLCAVLALTGCAQTMLMKDGLTEREFEADKFDCEQKVVTMYGGYAQMGVGHAIMARQDIFRCMAAKGYREAMPEEVKAAVTPKKKKSAPTLEEQEALATPTELKKPGGTTETFKADRRECMQQFITYPDIRQCLASKGYVPLTPEEVAAHRKAQQ